MDHADPIPADAAAQAPEEKRKKGGLADTTRFLLLLFVFAILLRSFFLSPFVIPSPSMLPRMMIGDFLFVAKWPYGYSRYSIPFGLASFDGRILRGEPERGDIIVFRYPGKDDDYVKRLIGLPGDRVQMRAGQLFLNGKAVPKVRIADFLVPISLNSPCDEPVDRVVAREDGRFCAYARFRETLPGGRSYEVLDQFDSWPGDDTGILTVPEGHYFMLGDNRDNSSDSRFARPEGVGFVPRDYLVGRALIVFFSTDGSAKWIKPWTWFSAARWDRIGETY